MIVQAGAVWQVLAESPAEARAAMLAVEASGRAAMTELRHLLGLLSPTNPAVDAAGTPDGVTPAELAPQPGLAQLPALVDRLTAAGLPIDLRVEQLPVELSPGFDLAVFRVIQEALTNVIKHAGHVATRVEVTRTGEVLDLRVTNAPPTAAPADLGSGGHGLDGIRRRAALFGGEVFAGPVPGGGYALRATLRLEEIP